MTLRHMRVWQYVEEVARAGSMRKAAERLNVTASAIQRRIQDVEDDLGAKIFERAARGVRVTPTGELFLSWLRSQSADLERVQSQIDDLAGLRRGRVKIACSQGLVHSFLPKATATFQRRFPLVAVQVGVFPHAGAISALVNLEADLALVFRPGALKELYQFASVPQSVVAIMRASHPLARHAAVSLRDCARYPVAILDRSFGSRQIVDRASPAFNVVLESNSTEMLRNFVRNNDAITFQIEIGAPAKREGSGLTVCRIKDSRVERGPVVLGKLKGRTLPIAAAAFADHIAARMHDLRRVS